MNKPMSANGITQHVNDVTDPDASTFSSAPAHSERRGYTKPSDRTCTAAQYPHRLTLPSVNLGIPDLRIKQQETGNTGKRSSGRAEKGENGYGHGAALGIDNNQAGYSFTRLCNIYSLGARAGSDMEYMLQRRYVEGQGPDRLGWSRIWNTAFLNSTADRGLKDIDRYFSNIITELPSAVPGDGARTEQAFSFVYQKNAY